VPAILRANACQNLKLKAKVVSYLLGFKRKVQITAFCTKSNEAVFEPEIGCGQCHTLPNLFKEIENN
jgi:hypothetical protein